MRLYLAVAINKSGAPSHLWLGTAETQNIKFVRRHPVGCRSGGGIFQELPLCEWSVCLKSSAYIARACNLLIQMALPLQSSPFLVQFARIPIRACSECIEAERLVELSVSHFGTWAGLLDSGTISA
jgi:hypothetical protein